MHLLTPLPKFVIHFTSWVENWYRKSWWAKGRIQTVWLIPISGWWFQALPRKVMEVKVNKSSNQIQRFSTCCWVPWQLQVIFVERAQTTSWQRMRAETRDSPENSKARKKTNYSRWCWAIKSLSFFFCFWFVLILLLLLLLSSSVIHSPRQPLYRQGQRFLRRSIYILDTRNTSIGYGKHSDKQSYRLSRKKHALD